MKKIAILSSVFVILTMSNSVMAATDGHSEASGGLPQFDPTWFASQIFWLAVAFAILYIFFSKKALPDISNIIENRKNHIQSDLEIAEKLTEEANTVQQEYQARLLKSQNEAAKLMNDAETEMKQVASEATESFRARAEKEIKAAESEVERAQEAIMDEINSIAAEAASEAVSKILGTKTDVQKAKTIIESLTDKAKAA